MVESNEVIHVRMGHDHTVDAQQLAVGNLPQVTQVDQYRAALVEQIDPQRRVAGGAVG